MGAEHGKKDEEREHIEQIRISNPDYTLIMYSNGEPMGITPSEASGMITCLGVIAVVSLLLYLVYRLTLKKVCSVTIDSKTAFPH